MWTNPKTLDDVFPDAITGGGIFGALQLYDVPWKDENINTLLDIDYVGNQSGQKYISPMVNKIMKGETLTPTEINIIAQTLIALFNRNWIKLWDTMELEYDPIENYNMTEALDDTRETTYGRTDTRTDALTHTKTGTEALLHGETITDNIINMSHTKTGTETTGYGHVEQDTPNLTTDVNEGIAGFNSISTVLSNSQNRVTSGSTTKTHSGQDVNTYNLSENDSGSQTSAKSGTDTTTHNITEGDTGTQTSAASGKDTEDHDYTLTRSGNIGVTTSQQMIEQERKLWIWNFFRDTVYKDIDSVLTLPIY